MADTKRMQELSDWKDAVQTHVTTAILPFWMDKVCDPAGGFFGGVDCNGAVQKDSVRSAVLNTRILWTFSAASRLFGAAYRRYADWAYSYLCDHFLDKKNGGIFWMLDATGKPVNTRKQIYAQAFAIYAFAEYAALTKSDESLEIAKSLFRVIEDHGAAPQGGGYIEARGESWEMLEDQRLSDKDLNCPKSMNTHLHIMEGYTNLLRVWRDPALVAAQKALLTLTMDRIIDAESGHFKLFFDENWHSLNDHVSYGHDIEGSWLLVEAAEVLGDEAILARAQKIALKMAEAVYDQALDKDGSLFYEADSTGKLIDPKKHWWAQAETVVGFFNAWQMSGREDYLTATCASWDYIMAKVADPVHGEWRAKLAPDGRPLPYAEDHDACLAGPWKCPYHNSRCCFEIYSRIGGRGAAA